MFNEQDNYNQPQKAQIIQRLAQIQDYLKQAYLMLNKLDNDSSSSSSSMDYTLQVNKLHTMINHLKDQEKGYINVLNSLVLNESEINTNNNNNNQHITTLAAANELEEEKQRLINLINTKKEQIKALKKSCINNEDLKIDKLNKLILNSSSTLSSSLSSIPIRKSQQSLNNFNDSNNNNNNNNNLQRLLDEFNSFQRDVYQLSNSNVNKEPDYQNYVENEDKLK
jgi:hypothetical protein